MLRARFRARFRPAAIDGLVALLVLAAAVAGSGDQVAGWLPPFAVLPLGAAQAALLLSRRRAPLAGLAGTTAVAAFMVAVGYPAGSSGAAVLAAAYAVAVHADPPWTGNGAWGRGPVAVLAAAAALTAAMGLPGSRTRDAGAWPQLTLGLAVAVAWLSGHAVRTRRAHIRDLEDRAARLEREEGERAVRAVAEERLRIARELHDIVGHSLSLISIQSEAAARSLRADPGAVPDFLTTISATSRQALAQLRHALALLRPDEEDELSPQPGLADLPDLVARLTAAGLPVRLDARPPALPAAVGLTVYRIAQEALTNVLKHAGPHVTSVTVTVVLDPADGPLHVSVRDDGTGDGLRAPAHGLLGMRERVALYGGTLHAGPVPGGGFQVHATIPRSEATE
ncbi:MULTISPECIES: sensor histidine kinase [unclassified Kitasatospora]|uniref:sensor histidine kinase n=1 Tax=unclassified Kitasatospora TaxID=2633591 RepID=UPI002476526F|nr:sensor histidine kinase [Kitasatospora sp. MAP12-44]